MSADYWFKQDDGLRYVYRVLDSEATPEDRKAAQAIIYRLRTEVRHMGQAAERALALPAESAQKALADLAARYAEQCAFLNAAWAALPEWAREAGIRADTEADSHPLPLAIAALVAAEPAQGAAAPVEPVLHVRVGLVDDTDCRGVWIDDKASDWNWLSLPDGCHPLYAAPTREAGSVPAGCEVEIDYTNWRGERATRLIRPAEVRFASHRPYHPEKQWLLRAFDIEKRDMRDFAMRDIHSWQYPPTNTQRTASEASGEGSDKP